MITIVSGFQRCGSSLMCQMLAAGGMRVFHDEGMGYPSFETMLQFDRPWDSRWFTAIDGGAVKWLEPQRTMPPPVDIELRVLWLTRDHRQQAKSAIKFLRLVGGLPVPSKAVGQFTEAFDRDEPRAMALWQSRAAVHVVRFEDLLQQPAVVIRQVIAFLGVPLSASRMEGQVVLRGTKCLEGFLELHLLQRTKERLCQ